MSTFPTMLAPHTGSGKRQWREICRATMSPECRARAGLIAYSRLEHNDSSMVTWSAAVILSFTMTPRIRRLVTISTWLKVRSVSSSGSRTSVRPGCWTPPDLRRHGASTARRCAPIMTPRAGTIAWIRRRNAASWTCYQLEPVLANEAQFVTEPVALPSERRLWKQQRRRYVAIHGRLHQLCMKLYDSRHTSPKKFLRDASRVYSPAAEWL